MIIKTKKYQLSTKTYLILSLKNIIYEQWWVLLIVLVVSSGSIFFHSIWFFISSVVGFLLYCLFWLIQFFGVTQFDENKIIFAKLSYEINSQKILIKVSTKQGMPVLWKQIQHAYIGKKSFLLVLSKAHIIYFPYKVFNSSIEIKFLEATLRRKKLLKKLKLL